MSSLITDGITTAATGTAAQFTSANPVLLAGEWGLETDTGKAKIGDGTTAWTSLDYSTDPTFQTQIDSKLTGSTDQLCKAWVNFDGTDSDPITPNASFNVTNVTKTATGDYTVNFTNAFSNTNYVCAAMGSRSTTANNTRVPTVTNDNPPTTTTYRFTNVITGGNTLDDTEIITLLFFGT